MKFRRTLSASLISILLCIAIVGGIIYFQVVPKGMQEFKQFVLDFVPSSNSGFSIEIDSVDSTLMRSIKLNDVKLSKDGEPLVHVPSVSASINLFDIVRVAFGKTPRKIDVSLNGMYAFIDDAVFDLFLGEKSEGVEQENDGFSVPSMFDDVDVTLSVNDASLDMDALGIEAGIRKLNARFSLKNGKSLSMVLSDSSITAESDEFDVSIPRLAASGNVSLNQGLAIEGFNANIPSMSFFYQGIDQRFFLEDLRFALNSDNNCSVSLSKIYSNDISVEGLSGAANLSDEKVEAAFFVDDGCLNFNEDSLDFESLLVRAVLGGDDSVADIGLNASFVNVQLPNIHASLNGVLIDGSINGTDSYKASVHLDGYEAKYNDYLLRGENLDGAFAMDESSNIQVSLDLATVNASGLNDFLVERLNGERFSLDFIMSEKSVEAFFSADMKGKSTNETLGDFSLSAEAYVLGDDIKNVSDANVSLWIDSLACLSSPARVNISYERNKDIGVALSVGSELLCNLAFDINESSLETSLYLSSLKPDGFSLLFENLIPETVFYNKQTTVDGNLFVSAKLAGNTIDDLLHGKEVSFGSPVDLIEEGRLSLNLAANDFLLSGSSYSGAVSFESSLNKRKLNVDSLALTLNGLRLSYSGVIDVDQMLPEGVLLLQRATNGNELATLVFEYDQVSNTYGFNLSSSVVDDSTLSGSVSWQDEDRVFTKALIDSKFIRDRELPFSLTIMKSPLEFILDGDKISADVSFSDSILDANLNIVDLGIDVSDTMSIDANAEIVGVYDLLDHTYDFSVSDLFVKVSDILNLGFDLEVTDHSLQMSELYIGRAENSYPFDGMMSFTFRSLSDIISGDTSSLEGTIDFSNNAIGNFTKGAVTEDQFYFETSSDVVFLSDFKFLGRRGEGFYGSGYIGSNVNEDFGLRFNARYNNGAFDLYDSFGWYKNFSLDSISLSADLINWIVDGSFDFKNTINRLAGDSIQKGTITIGLKRDALTSGFLSLAGLENKLDFSLGLKDIDLNGFRMKDTALAVSFENGSFDIVGDDINGIIDLDRKYFEVGFDQSLLFGFNAKGYFGDELDIMVNDLVFPLPIVNQFLNISILDLLEGQITGDFLVKGPSKAPGLYGMLYCQSFGMDLFYLPGQVINVNNLAIALQGHSITASKTPLVGFSSIDGRFFRGNVSVEANIQGIGLESLFVNAHVDDDAPVDFWLPLLLGGTTELNIRGDVSGDVQLQIQNGINLITDITARNSLIDFSLDPVPSWFGKEHTSIGLDITITTGKDVEFFYPDSESPFLNFAANEGETVHLVVDRVTGGLTTDGSLSFKTGQIFYFQNDFYITEGSLDISQKKYSMGSGIPMSLDLTAKLKDYDASGNRVEISLILQDASLDNISPRFESTPSMSENEIIQMLGQTILPSGSFDGQMSMASIASLAVAATNAFAKLGIIESNGNYSLTGTLREALGLDIFSARSAILSNIIVDALPGQFSSSRISLIARYLDGTSLFAGKYIGQDFFARLSLMLRADNSFALRNDVGHFLSKDLILDVEFSLDWDNPIGTFSVFTQPRELSVFSILDTIGFSVTKKIKF